MHWLRTIGSVSNDGDASNRLSDALDQIFSSSSRSSSDVVDDVIDEAADEPYELPEIVPATEDAPSDSHASQAPTLPARTTDPEPELVRRPEPVTSPSVAPVSAVATTAAASTPTSTPATASASTPATSWADHVAPVGAHSAGLRAPGRKPRVRRVTRVLRHIDPWSTFKVGLLFSLVAYLVALTSGVLLWRVADSTGTLDNVERWFTQFGWETFELQGSEIFHNAWIIGLFGVVAMTGGLVLLATLFNLVSDIIGGVRVTVLEEEVVERTVSSTRRYVVRQGPAAAGATAAVVQDWDVDDDEPSPAAPQPAPPVEVPDADWSVDD